MSGLVQPLTDCCWSCFKHILWKLLNSFSNNFLLSIPHLQSLLELHKRRKAVTEPEARYYMTQLLKGVHYLHKNRVIHRDLKLGNIFLNDDMEVKIGESKNNNGKVHKYVLTIKTL